MRPISPRVVVLLRTLGLVGLFARPAAAADWTAAPADTSFGSGRQDFRYTSTPAAPSRMPSRCSTTAPRRWRSRPRRRRRPGLELAQAAVTVPAGETAEVPLTLTLAARHQARRPARRDRRQRRRDRGHRAGQPARRRPTSHLHWRWRTSASSTRAATPPSSTRCTTPATRSSPPGRPCPSPVRSAASSPSGRSPPTRRPWRPARAGRARRRWPASRPRCGCRPRCPCCRCSPTRPASVAPLKEVKASGHGWAIPLLPIVGLLVVIAVAATAARTCRRRRRPVFAA